MKNSNDRALMFN